MADIKDLRIRVTAETKGLKDISTSAQKTAKDVESVGKKGSTAFQQLERSGKGAVSTFSLMAKSIAATALQFSVLGTAIGAALSPVVIARATADFQQQLSRIVGLTGTSREQVQLWEKDLKRLGPATGKSLQELADALYFVASSGIDTSKALSVVEASAKASAAGLGETKVIADLVTSAINAYGESNLSATRAADILVAAVREGKGEASDLAEALGRVIPISAQMGVSFDQVSAAVAAMTRSGLDANEATTALRGIFLAILNPSAEAEKALKGMGTSAEELRKTLRERGLLAALNDINNLTKKYGSELSTVFPEARALTGALNIMGAEAAKTADIFDSVNNSLGDTDRAFQVNAENVNFLWDQLKSRLNVILIELGEHSLPVVIQVLDDLGAEFSDFAAEMDRFVSNTGIITFWRELADEISRIPGLGGVTQKLRGGNAGLIALAPGLAPFLLIKKELELTNDALEHFGIVAEDAGKSADVLTSGTIRLGTQMQTLEGDVSQTVGVVNEVGKKADAAAEGVKNFTGAMTGGGGGGGRSPVDTFNASLQKQVQILQRNIETFGLTNEQLVEYDRKATIAAGGSEELANKVAELRLQLLALQESVGFGDLFQESLNDAIAQFEEAKNRLGDFEDVEDGVEQLQDSFGSLDDFIGEVAANISNTMADALTAALTGSFDDIKRSWKDMLKYLLNTFLQIVTSIAANPIRIFLEGLFGLGGTKGAGGGAGGIVGTGQQAVGLGTDIAGLFGAGGAFGTLFGGAAGSTAIAGTLGGIPITGGAAAGAGLISGGAGVLATVGAAVTIIGAVLGAATLAFTLLSGLFKKTPRLDIDFDSIKTEVGRRAAEVAEFLDPEFFKEQIAQISVKRSAGLGVGGDDAIKDIIQKKIAETVDAVQAIINKLPEELADQLNEALLNTPVDIETVVKGERLLEFDAKGKEIAKKFQAFINGELSAKFLFAIRDFFVVAFESLGVLPDKAQEFIDAEFEKFKNAGSREERAAIGQELLASFNAFVDAFNIVSGNVNDAISITIANTKSLAKELGFEAVPSIGELREELGKLLENAELDPETVQKYVDLRNAIVQGVLDIGNAVAGLISKIQSLNQTIVSLGGAGVDLGPFLDQAQADLINFFQANVGDLSLAEQEAFLDEIAGFAQAQLAEERAAFEAEQAAAQAAAEAAKAAVQARIDGLNKEKDKINEIFRNRIDALNEELRIAEDFARLTEQIRETLDSILFSPESVLTGVEQVNLLQSRIANLQANIAQAIDPEERLKLADQLREAFSNLFDAAGEAFGVNSPEFVSIFATVTDGLESLANLTASQGRSVEEINAEIEKLTAENQEILKGIDARIEAAQAQISAISQQTANNTFKASEKLQETLNWLRDEYLRILEERLNQLDEATTGGFENELDALEDVAQTSHEMLENLTGIHGEAQDTNGILKEISAKLGGSGGGTTTGGGPFGADNNPLTPYASGGPINERIFGIGDSGRRYLFGEAGREWVIPESRMRNVAHDESGGNKRYDIYVHGDNPATIDSMYQKLRKDLGKDLGGDLANQIHAGERNPRVAVQRATGQR